MRRFENPLDSIRIASPCPADWDEMVGDERKRFCAQCSLDVFNLSEMTRAEAEQFLFESEGRICARFYRRKDGTVITRDCPVGARKLRDRVRTTAVAFTSVIATFIAGLLSIRGMETIIDRLPIGDVPAPSYLEMLTVLETGVPEVGQVGERQLLLGEVDVSGNGSINTVSEIRPSRPRRR